MPAEKKTISPEFVEWLKANPNWGTYGEKPSSQTELIKAIDWSQPEAAKLLERLKNNKPTSLQLPTKKADEDKQESVDAPLTPEDVSAAADAINEVFGDGFGGAVSKGDDVQAGPENKTEADVSKYFQGGFK